MHNVDGMSKKRPYSQGQKGGGSRSSALDSGKVAKRFKKTSVRTTATNKKTKDKPSADETNNVHQTIDVGPPSEKWSKSKKKRMRKFLSKVREGHSTNDGESSVKRNGSESAAKGATTEPTLIVPTNDSGKNKSSMQDSFKARLAGSRFRSLNEDLYTTTSQHSFERFSKNPELLEQYHEGFRHQVSSWPENPVDTIVRSLVSTYAHKDKNERNASQIVVADFGCGDAQLAKDLSKVRYSGKGKGNSEDDRVFLVHSFDLVACNEFVTACDMANVPLEAKSVDVCVFCLALMGTNLTDFLREAHRVLKDDGLVKIAEVRSRIEYSHSRDGSSTDETEGTLAAFVLVLKQLGFACIKTDRSNTMFLMLDLTKNGKIPDKKLQFTARPCIYKRR